jgi:release factor glutamine methyltransferase
MTSQMTLQDISRIYRSTLAGMYSDEEIRNIFYRVAERLLNYSKIDIHVRDRQPISEETVTRFADMLDRLKGWEPVQYVTGLTWFYGFPIEVDQNVLIPRQETEELVDWVLKETGDKPLTSLDIGTGSGCIAIALAGNRPSMQVSACDFSMAALELARKNASKNGLPIDFFRYDLLDGTTGLPGRYHRVVSNPPYVRESEKSTILRNVLDYEPDTALFVPDADPLLYYRQITLLCRKSLLDGGKLFFEINENLAREVVRLLESAGFFAIEVRKDLNGKERMVRAVK